jgi:hypothetical protein
MRTAGKILDADKVEQGDMPGLDAYLRRWVREAPDPAEGGRRAS